MRRVLLALALVIAACGGGSAEERPIAQVLEEAGTQFEELDSVRFEITVDGVPVSFDDEGTLTASNAEGQYAAPGSFQAVVNVTAFGLTAQLGAISIGSDRWVSDPVTGQFQILPIDIGFDPRLLFDDSTGVGETVRTMDAELIGYDGTYLVRGTVEGPTVRVLTAGLVPDGDLDVDFFIDGETLDITSLEFETAADGGVSMWSITFSEFDEPVSIEPPE